MDRKGKQTDYMGPCPAKGILSFGLALVSHLLHLAATSYHDAPYQYTSQAGIEPSRHLTLDKTYCSQWSCSPFFANAVLRLPLMRVAQNHLSTARNKLFTSRHRDFCLTGFCALICASWKRCSAGVKSLSLALLLFSLSPLGPLG